MDISASLVQKLRAQTGSGVKDCKEALASSEGNLEKAIEYLRKKGLATADKKENRATEQGKIFTRVSPDGKSGVILELNCETDFVANTNEFLNLGEDLCEHIIQKNPASVSEEGGKGPSLLKQNFIKEEGKTVEIALKERIGKLQENITIRRFARFQYEKLSYYIHAGGKAGVLLGVSYKPQTIESHAGFQDLLKDICMQICAMKPIAIRRENVPPDIIEKEKEIYRAQTKDKQGPILEKIVQGKLDKFFKDNILLEQLFIKDEKKDLSKYIKDKVSEMGGGEITLNEFVRYTVGGS